MVPSAPRDSIMSAVIQNRTNRAKQLEQEMMRSRSLTSVKLLNRNDSGKRFGEPHSAMEDSSTI